MAMTINSSPVLTGESAKAFFEEAERNGKLPTPRLSPEREFQLREYDRKCREFYHQLFEEIQADNHQNRLPVLHLYD